METATIAGKLVSWIKDRVEASGGEGVVFGLSGGVDSAVVAVLCQRAFPCNIQAINLPCYSQAEDEQHAGLVADKFSIPFQVISLDVVFNTFLKKLPDGKPEKAAERIAKSNLKARLRMAALYNFANRLNYRVIGSGNRSELVLGYFTKYGDGGVDFLPIGGLVKQQVFELAEFLGLPRLIIEKPPSAGLWPGQTDEAEMGFTYKELDRFLLTGKEDTTVKSKIQAMM